MSSGGWKKPFEQIAGQDSRVAAELGRGLHWQGLVDEAKHNEQNPGRAMTKATINAALWYLGGEAGSALGGAGEAGAAAGEGAYNAMTAEQIAQNLAPVAAGENVGSMGGLLAAGSPQGASTAGLLSASAPQGLANTMESAITDTGYTPSSLGYAVQNANSANGTSLGQNLGNYYKDAATNMQNGSMLNHFMSGASGQQSKQLAMNMGLKMLTPQQPQPMPQGAPAPQGQQGPLNNPYQNNPYGPGGNSLGLSEEQKQKLRAMGYRIP